MSKRKPRMSNIERVLNRGDVATPDARRRYAENNAMCPDHLRHLPCFKCGREQASS